MATTSRKNTGSKKADKSTPAKNGGKAGEKTYWLDDPKNVDRLVRWFFGACAFLFLIDVFVPKHGEFAIEHIFGFYAIYGFVACVILVLVAKQMRRIVMRPEDYYDR